MVSQVFDMLIDLIDLIKSLAFNDHIRIKSQCPVNALFQHVFQIFGLYPFLIRAHQELEHFISHIDIFRGIIGYGLLQGIHNERLNAVVFFSQTISGI